MHRVKLLSTWRCPYGARVLYNNYTIRDVDQRWTKTAESSLPYLHYICIPMDWPDLLDRTLQTVVKSVRDYASAKTQATKSIPKTSQRGNHIIANESTLGMYNIQTTTVGGLTQTTTVGGLTQTTYVPWLLRTLQHSCLHKYVQTCTQHPNTNYVVRPHCCRVCDNQIIQKCSGTVINTAPSFAYVG